MKKQCNRKVWIVIGTILLYSEQTMATNDDAPAVWQRQNLMLGISGVFKRDEHKVKYNLDRYCSWGGWSHNPLKEATDDVRQYVNGIDSQLAALQSQTSQIPAMLSKINTLEAKNRSLTADVASLRADNAVLNSRVATSSDVLHAAIKKLEEKLDAFKNETLHSRTRSASPPRPRSTRER
jgi:hypothetical protein